MNNTGNRFITTSRPHQGDSDDLVLGGSKKSNFPTINQTKLIDHLDKPSIIIR